ncbi:MAG: DnaD domain protein [SAR202 cluster bacterium]|jgi:DnaD/phage-associated family protein|nr:DnaD domain protein [SAR202 cluster bacterium]MDP7224176.1 DnaD domain protein [SAR202 cluster bacterium]MDP7414893.1 DnaD domain protein [SAR202 cluster bacterium]|tara:strand:- start:6645 stop:7331 length:687 start_codon:yes stop_codon:yes gene_type:complete
MQQTRSEKYAGFPRKVRYVPVPGPLLGPLLEQIDDLAELKCTLRLIAMLHQKRGFPRFVSLGELQADGTLVRSLPDGDGTAAQKIERAMASAVRRGAVAVVSVEQNGVRQQLFALNTETDRAAMDRMSGESDADSTTPVEEPWQEPEGKPNIFALYEQNIGMLSPMIADELREAEDLYPEEWLRDAIRESVGQNKRSWRYIASILERWEREGRGNGKPGRYPKKTRRY